MSEEKRELTLDDVKNPADYDIDQLFKDANENVKVDPYLTCTFWGPPESGKTYCALTFPGPVRIIDLDGGVQVNLKYFTDKKTGKLIKDIKHIRCVSWKDNVNPDDAYDWKKVDPINTLRNFDVALTLLQRMKGGTVIVDTMTAVNTWLKQLMEAHIPKKTAESGKEYIDQIDWKYANQKWLWIWEKLKNVEANVVVIAQEKPIYQGREATGEYEADLRMNPEYQTSIFAKFGKEVSQEGDKVVTKRVASFSKFRGNRLAKEHKVEDCTYDKIMAILKAEDKV